MKEYCERCRLALREWEWCGRGFCEICEDQMSHREKEIRIRLESQREIWVETVKSAADRLSGLIGPSANDVAWLSSVVGQLAMQASEYSELRGRLSEERSKAKV